MRVRILRVAVALASLGAAATAAVSDGLASADQPRPSLLVGAITGDIVIDGRLEEADWSSAPSIPDLTMLDPTEGGTPTGKTEVRVVAGPSVQRRVQRNQERDRWAAASRDTKIYQTSRAGLLIGLPTSRSDTACRSGPVSWAASIAPRVAPQRTRPENRASTCLSAWGRTSLRPSR